MAVCAFMLGTFTLVFAVAVADPRPQLVELQLGGKTREALARADAELAAQPEAARRFGLDYLRGRLLEALGASQEADEAFLAAMAATPALDSYSRYRMALEQERMGHPEVAAGLIAKVVGSDPSSPLLPEAASLFAETLRAGGDCKLLRTIRLEALLAASRRQLLVAQAECAFRLGMPELGRSLLAGLLAERRDDEPARDAADLLAVRLADPERGRLRLLLGKTFLQHRELERAVAQIKLAFGPGLAGREAFEARLTQGRAQLAAGNYAAAAVIFGELAQRTDTAAERAEVLYQQGRCYELLGRPKNAAASFRLAYRAEPQGEWAAAALFSSLRLEWRAGGEAAALELFAALAAQRPWADHAARAALFFAASDLVRGRSDRARSWLDRAALGGQEARLEALYWRGRLAELESNGRGAVAAYLALLRADLFHPHARAAVARLEASPLSRTAVGEGRRLAASGLRGELYDAWLLLGSNEPEGRAARRKLLTILLADPVTSPYLRLSHVPVRDWPLWADSHSKPPEMLLALGLFDDGKPAVARYFPTSKPSLAYTGSQLLARAGEHRAAIALAESLRARAPTSLPAGLIPHELRRLFYPNPYQKLIDAQAQRHGVDPAVLAALIREESIYDRLALSPASARGLAQLTMDTARRLAPRIEAGRLEPEDLYRPEISIALGAANLGLLVRDFGGASHLALAAYNAGKPQATVWRSYCYTDETEEYLSKVGFRETRAYLRRVLSSAAQYEELY